MTALDVGHRPRRRLGSLGLGASVVTTFSVCLLTVFVVGLLGTALAFRGWNDRLADRREEAITALDAAALRQTLTAADLSLHAYVHTRNEADLARHRQLLDSADEQLAALEERVAGIGEVAAETDAVAVAASEWEDAISEPEDMRDVPADAEVAADTLDDSLDTLLTAQATRFDSAGDAAGEAGRYTTTVLGLTFALVAALCALGIWVARRWLTEPMRRLRDQVTEPGHQSTISADGPLELREIGAAINEMRRDLVAERDKAARARDALEQNAVLAAQVGAELGGVLGSFPTGWAAAADLRPATGVVAGDTYAVKLLGPHTIGVLLLDIVGHGAEPAIIALRCREVVLAGLRHGLDPGDALEGLKAHDHGLDHGNFLTAFLGVIDTDTGRFRYANAGHPPALLVEGDVVTELGQTGPVFGPFPGRSWSTGEVVVGEGARLVVYSDGVIEARNGSEFYGLERLTACVGATPAAPEDDRRFSDAAAALAAIHRDLDLFGETHRRDDQSIVVVSHLDSSPSITPAVGASYAAPA